MWGVWQSYVGLYRTRNYRLQSGDQCAVQTVRVCGKGGGGVLRQSKLRVELNKYHFLRAILHIGLQKKLSCVNVNSTTIHRSFNYGGPRHNAAHSHTILAIQYSHFVYAKN